MFETSTRCGAAGFTALVRRNGGEHARLGVVLAKRNLPGAVLRNRVRRLVREGFRMRCARLAGLDIVVLGGSRVRGCAPAQLRQALDRLWEKVFTCNPH